MLANKLASGLSEHRSEDDCDEDRVVERSCDRDEVRDEIEWERQVADQCNEQPLVAARYATITRKTGEEDDAVRNESCPRSSIRPPAHQEQREEKDEVHRQRQSESEAEEFPHALVEP